MNKKLKIVLVIAMLAVALYMLVSQPWQLHNITVVTGKRTVRVDGRLNIKNDGYVVRVPAHMEKVQQTRSDSVWIVDRQVPAQILYFPMSAVDVIIVE